MSRCKLRTPRPIHFKLRIVIGIDSLMVCILFGEISIFHSRVMGLYSSNCSRFFVCRAVNWEPLHQFTSNFVLLLELIVFTDFSKNVVFNCINIVYMFQFMFMVQLLVKFKYFIQELWERKSLQILYECWRRAYHALLAQLLICCRSEGRGLPINLYNYLGLPLSLIFQHKSLLNN
jgi:hypothetical protein